MHGFTEGLHKNLCFHLQYSEDVDNRQVSEYTMCPVVIGSVKEKTRLRPSDEKASAVLDG